MIVSRIKKLSKGALEAILAILLVMLFYTGFLYFLNSLFPSGTSLKALIADHGSGDASELSAVAKGDFFRADDGRESDTASEVAAVLSMTRNDVKSKGAGQIAWRSASMGTSLYDRDAVQTLSRSAAAIRFAENTTLDMGSNSLVIIKRISHDPVYREKRSFMVLVEGDMRGKMDASDQDSVYLEIATPGAKFRTESGGPGAEQVDFKISVNPDKSTTISVYEGSAEVTAEGETVTVEANQSTVVALNQTPIDPRELPPAVKLKKPSGNNTFHYRDLPPKIHFAWKAQSNASRYHFMVARDAGFRDIVTDEVFSKTKFTHGNLKVGTYYWKVSAMDETIEGFFSESRKLSVVRDRKPPKLLVKFPPQTIYRGRYTLRGKTDPGAKVFVGGQRVKIAKNGSFKYVLKLRPGINIIVVEAFDAVNNVTYRTQRINRKI